MRLNGQLLSALLLIATLIALPGPARAEVRSLPPSATALVNDGGRLAFAYGYVPTGRTETRLAIDVLEIATGKVTTVAEDLPYEDAQLSLGDGTLAYRSGTTLTALRLADNKRRTIAVERLGSVAAFGEHVYWWQLGGAAARSQLFRADLSGHDGEPLTDLLELPLGVGPTRASAGWLAWAARTGFTKALACYTLQAMPSAGGAVQTIADLGCGRPHFDLRGSRLLYIDREGMLVRLDLAGNSQVRSGPHCAPVSSAGATADCGDLAGFSADGRYAYWAKVQYSATPRRADLWGFDTATGSAFQVAAGIAQDANSPWPETSAAGGMLAWLAHPASGSAELNTLPIAASLPNAPEAAPGPGRRLFPETQHSLGGEFRAFWERGGGLAVFGFPLTREFIQESKDDGKGYTVQYFERQRFELHPANAGTPYLVQIGRLGAEALAAAGRDWTALPKADPRTPHYFPATGQAIAPQFWSHWRGRGIDLGDPGVSEREALALWGYPLTPAAIERLPTGETLLVQWFERARFEHHPANAAPYDVLLGRLAAEQVEGFGWR